MFDNLTLRVAGLSASQLEGHTPAACVLARTLGATLLVVTFPLAFLAMLVYGGANIVPMDWPDTVRYPALGAAAFAYAIVILFGIDRPLIVAADAVDYRCRVSRWAMLLLRFVLVFITSYFVAHEILLWMYRAPIMETSRRIEIERNLQDSRELDRQYALSEKSQHAKEAIRLEQQLRAEQTVIPAAITKGFAAAQKCDAVAQQIASQIHGAERDTVEKAAGRVTFLRRQLETTTTRCHALLRSATVAKAAWQDDLNQRMGEQKQARQTAEKRLHAAAEAAEDGMAQGRKLNSEVARDGSSRDRAFTRLKKENPGIAWTAHLLQAGLLLLELLPLLLKQLSYQNPIFAAVRRDLQSGAERYRLELAFEEARNNAARAAYLDPAMQRELAQSAAQTRLSVEPFECFDVQCNSIEVALIRKNKMIQRYPDEADSISKMYLAALAAVAPKTAASHA